MVYTLLIIVFVVGYLAIALEHPIKIDKAASALITGVVVWAIIALAPADVLEIDSNKSITTLHEEIDALPKQEQKIHRNFKAFIDKEINEYHEDQHHLYEKMEGEDLSAADLQKELEEIKKERVPAEQTQSTISHFISHELLHHLSDIASILFFLLGAMTIVELIDAHEGFRIITDKIKTTNRVKLMWILCVITFFFSAALDNLTTSIVMAALLKKLMKDKKDILIFAGMVVISANAGGAWSPIGDVTTIMLWIDGQVTSANIITHVFVPSLVCMLIPLILISFKLKGEVNRPLGMLEKEHLINPTEGWERNLVFSLGVGGLLFVPIFKSVTHLEPFMGMMLSLGILWVVTEIMHRKKTNEDKSDHTVIGVLRKVDTPSVLFFLGILVAVAGLQTAGHLTQLADGLTDVFAFMGNADIYGINLAIGLLSSIVDNVPLVAGAMGMYDIDPTGGVFGVDGTFWEFLAYCAGTGGSCLIIGSAAGVAIMGILKIDFIWYLKNISWLAFVGYIGGAATYYLMF